ncbi:MAG: hypothetical protein ABMA64_14125 [Myxococcota bacterium]
MWLLTVAAWAADGAPPAERPPLRAEPARPIARDVRTALDSRRSLPDRARAIVAVAASVGGDADAALSRIALAVEGDPALGRVATAAQLQRADLDALATEPWPDWAAALVHLRIAEELPAACDDPAVRALPLPPLEVAQACGYALRADDLAQAARSAPDPVARAQAVRLLTVLADREPGPVREALVAAFAWDEPTPWAGEGPALDRLELPGDARTALATELVTRRLAAVQVGKQEVPPRLDAELRAVLAPELEAFGAPSQTVDWLHLLAASGADPRVVLTRLGLDRDHHYATVLDEDAALRGSARDRLPLLAHRSPIVRARAARGMEGDPAASLDALRRAWRFAPGRGPPLRGDVGTPALVRAPAEAARWERTLVRWARRSSHQRDGTALRAALWFAAVPATTTALTDIARADTARALLKLARRDEDPQRAADLVQGMDAVLRGVPFDRGAQPAPEEVQLARDVWARQGAPLAE